MYVITGATGNTGKLIAERLLAEGRRVRVLGRSAERLKNLESKGAEPFVCDLTNSASLTEAFKGATAVYVMEPPLPSSPDYRGFQDRVVDAAATAIRTASIPFAVTLSSLGADKPSGTGMIQGQYYLEQTFNQINELNVMHLRAGYFMENTLSQLSIYQAMGITAGPLQADLKLPLIATRDIAVAAAGELLKLDFTGSNTRELQGQRDLSMAEAMSIFGHAIGVSDLAYQQFSEAELRPALVQFGFSENVAGLILELASAYNSGHVQALESRSERNTTPTSYEEFVAQVMLPAYQNSTAFADSQQ